ncbi:type II toxin-antitoxin system VapC family toxin [Chamaesiphon polymorphus]|uniref:Nucleic acid-binding protein n=1 Tax=Chamaesiphon polymorphus CCALA 037 TaxID=2107692 RepID=A0A2T1G4J5_9CYAN|nr:PIN domain-containing protein [Chamaesiphon polymorphus]PSB52172.1 nucleic acid-binding protein [Chamaesiphon polymorphus CCALA 037]
MSQIVLLDTGILGMVTNPKANIQCEECKQWLNSLSSRNYLVALPEITDYELRRELIRAHKLRGIRQLDELKELIIYLPITTQVMLKAAELWAKARIEGYPTAHSEAIDGDVILAAQAVLIQLEGHSVTIATTNVNHLSHFVSAKTWEEI